MEVIYKKEIGLPRKINPVAQYLLTLAGFVGAYCIYVQFAVPFIEGSPALIDVGPCNPMKNSPRPWPSWMSIVLFAGGLRNIGVGSVSGVLTSSRVLQ